MKNELTNNNPANQAKEIRTEFGFERTICSCDSCSNHCRFIPGYLVPSDLERIARFLGFKNLVTFAIENLLASPGAIVMKNGRLFRIPTLVPRRKKNGSCLFLDERGGCKIHVVSPYGCAFFDSHQTQEEANMRSSRGLEEIARLWTHPYIHTYTVIWRMLHGAGLCAPSPQDARRQMEEAKTPNNNSVFHKSN